jgi:hypothetical protein
MGMFMELIIDQTGIMNLPLSGGRAGYGGGSGCDGIGSPASTRQCGGFTQTGRCFHCAIYTKICRTVNAFCRSLANHFVFDDAIDA